MLSSKLKRAKSGLQTTKKAYLEHCSHVGEEKKQLYDEKEKRAQTERGGALRIYEVSTEDRQSGPSIWCITHLYMFPSSHSDGNPPDVVSHGKKQWAGRRSGLACKGVSY